ncbi:MAG: CtsR family transcriptional regulator [Clostridiales bacterium]|jgi:transcriptional regulator CtsR|nr:CtsR family transcriptional regulator [Clostridiales bacterium]
MSRLSDIIEQFIKGLMEDASTDMLEIRRNELADHFNCAPSQINYVLATRFTIDKGYYIVSRRGGGGFIRIQKLDTQSKPYIGQIIMEYIGDSISQFDAERILDSMEKKGIITPREREIMKAAMNEKSMNVFSPSKDIVRAGLLKSMLSVLIRRD